jgi:hypothetical protein
MSLSQQEVRIATTVLETSVLALPIVGVILQYVSQSHFSERLEYHGENSYHTFILGMILSIAIPLAVSAFSSTVFLLGYDFPLFQATYLEISLIGIGSAAISTGSLILILFWNSRRSDEIKGKHEEFSYKLLGINRVAEQIKESDEALVEGETDEAMRNYLMWLWREDPEVFEALKEDSQNKDQKEMGDFSEDTD